MGNHVSPGVYNSESDVSDVISSSTGVDTSSALVGYSPKGSNIGRVLVTSKDQFIKEYGAPVPGNDFHYTALAFLQNGDVLYCRRVTAPFSAPNPCYFGGAKIRNIVDKIDNLNVSFNPSVDKIANLKATVSFGNTDMFFIVGRDPGVWNNKLSVRITKVGDENKPIQSIDLTSSGSVSTGNGIDLTKSFSLAGFIQTPQGTITINGSTFTLSNYLTVQSLLDAINASTIANCTITYNAVIDKFNITSPASQLTLAPHLFSSHNDFLTAIKIVGDVYKYTTGSNPNVLFDIVVYDSSSGVVVKVETWTVSRNHLLDGSGKQLYLMDKINGYSRYIRVIDNTTFDGNTFPMSQIISLPLAGGTAGDPVQDGDVNAGWDDFSNTEDVDVRVLINGGYTSPVVQKHMQSIAESRKDCICIFDPDANVTDTGDVTAMVDWRDNVQNIDSSYCALYVPRVKDYDNFSDKILELPPSGYVASQFAYNDSVGGVNYAPAGPNRGKLNILGLTKVFSQGERDILAPDGINSLQTFRGSGSEIYDQKTLQKKSTDLGMINVRRALITIEVALKKSFRQFLYEFNDDITRKRVVTMVNSYMDGLSAKRYFDTSKDKGFKVVCDTTNNTDTVRANNELAVDIYIKFIHAIRIIQLQTIVVGTAASFTELISQGTTI